MWLLGDGTSDLPDGVSVKGSNLIIAAAQHIHNNTYVCIVANITGQRGTAANISVFCEYLCFCLSLSVCPSICLSLHLFVYLSVCLSVCLSICPSVHSSICPSICLFNYQPDCLRDSWSISTCIIACLAISRPTIDCFCQSAPQSVCVTVYLLTCFSVLLFIPVCLFIYLLAFYALPYIRCLLAFLFVRLSLPHQTVPQPTLPLPNSPPPHAHSPSLMEM